jgi:hypothetical protein
MKIKIKLVTPWTTSEISTKRLIDQFKTSEEDLDGIEFVFDESYDIIFFVNYVEGKIKEGTRAYLFHHEPTWSGNHQNKFDESQSKITVFCFDKEYCMPRDWCVETPAHTFYGGRGSWVDSEDDWNYKKVSEYEFLLKTKNISSTVSTWRLENEPIECTYGDRFRLIENLIKELRFLDFYGGWGDYDNAKPDPQKLAAVKDYRFSLSIENQFIKNWITEKFYDCIITNTVPIYYGCPNIKEIYPEDGYILLESIKDINYVSKTLIEVNKNCKEIYEKKLPGLIALKKRYFKEYNFLRKIRQLSLEGLNNENS